MTNDTNTLNGALMELGETLADNLNTIGITDADPSDGLTTLANKVLDVNLDVRKINYITTITNPTIIVTSGTSVISATVLDSENDPVTNQEVWFYANNILIGKGVTNSNGVATLSEDMDGNSINGYTGLGNGRINIIATVPKSQITNPITLIDANTFDKGIASDYNNIWTLSHCTMTRETNYTKITETNIGTNLICKTTNGTTNGWDFEIYQGAQGTNDVNIMTVRAYGGTTNLMTLKLSEINTNLGEWAHIRIDLNGNVATITNFTKNLIITKTLASTSNNGYILLFGTPGDARNLYFRNVYLY